MGKCVVPCEDDALRCAPLGEKVEKCKNGLWAKEKDCELPAPFCLDRSTDTSTLVDCWDGTPYASVDTTQGHVQLANTANEVFGPDLTIAAWVKATNNFNAPMALLKNGVSGNYCGSVWVGVVPNGMGAGIVDYNVSPGGGSYKCGGILFPVTDTNLSSYPLVEYSLTGSEWIHLAITTAALETKLYVNGSVTPVATGTSTAAAQSYASSNLLWVGREAGINPQAFLGNIAHLQIWKRALEPAEIALIGKRAGRMPPDTTDLYGYWPFDEGMGTTAADASPNGHTGQLVGAHFVTN